MPRTNLCRTQSQRDKKLDEMISARLKILGTPDYVGSHIGVSGQTVRNWRRDPGLIGTVYIRKIQRMLRAKDETLVIPWEAFG